MRFCLSVSQSLTPTRIKCPGSILGRSIFYLWWTKRNRKGYLTANRELRSSLKLSFSFL